MNERTDCAFYSEWKDMNATVPCCDIYGIGNCKCSDCKKYVSKDDRVLVVRCKDCKWWGVYDEPIKHCRLGMLRLPVLGFEYCSKGERKE